MVRDTLLGFPSHALPYRYRKSYHFIDRLKHAARRRHAFSAFQFFFKKSMAPNGDRKVIWGGLCRNV